MTSSKSLKYLLTTVVMLFSFGTSAYADIGPKPTIKFDLKYSTEKPTSIESAVLMQCQDAECEKGVPLEHVGPQHFVCDIDSCNALAYGFAPYQKLILTFSGKQHQSPVFEYKEFNAIYRVNVTESALQVTFVSSRDFQTAKDHYQEDLENAQSDSEKQVYKEMKATYEHFKSTNGN